MKTKVIERNELIATRVPPGDRWTLIDDSKKIILILICVIATIYFTPKD